jgi:predicted ATPase
MRISHLRLENWRNFRSVDVALQDRTFLVGPNASGKSNFLDAFRFLRDIAAVGGGFEKAVLDRGGVSRLRWLGARRYPQIALDATIEDGARALWRYRIAFTQDNLRRPQISDETVWHEGRIMLKRPEAKDTADSDRLRQTHLEQVAANKEFRQIADFFASIRYYHIVPQLVREPERWQGREASPFGADFVERILRTPVAARESRLKRIERALQVAVPQLTELRVERDESGIAHLKARYSHWRPQGAWHTEFEFSDGTLRLLGLLWALLDGSGPILLEEPELSLHAEVVRHLPQLMARVAGRSSRQVLLSTHSFELLSDTGIGPGEVLLFEVAKEGTTVRAGDSVAEVRELLDSGLTVGEAILPMTRPERVERLGTMLG